MVVRYALLLAGLAVAHVEDRPRTSAAHATALARDAEAGIAVVDTAHSVVRWRGTKFGGRSAHAGIVRVRQGVLQYDPRKAEVQGGRIELDMRSIAVTDMPSSERSARAKLTKHLLAAEFFDVVRYPVATFVIDRARQHDGNLLTLDGRLSMRGVTRPLSLSATIWSYEPTHLHATARASLDRMQWGVAFRGSRLTNDLVDDLVTLEFDVVARVTAAQPAWLPMTSRK
jgi:polyisoprenoid-binding protein YceI